MTVAGVPASRFYRDAGTFIETSRAVAAYYGIDRYNNFADVYNFEIEAMGGKMVYSDNAMPTIDFRDPLVKAPEDLRKLRTPDFRSDGRLPYALDCIRLSGSGSGSFCGIFSMAVGMRTYPMLVKDMRKRPGFVRDLFTFIIDQVLLPYLKVQREYCGITFATGADAWVSVPGLSISELNQWVLPYNRLLMEKAGALGIAVRSGGGDYGEQDPERFDMETARKAFDFQIATKGGASLSLWHGPWLVRPLEPVREYTAKFRAQGIRFSIDAGVNARLLRDGPTKLIVDAVKRYIDAFARDHRLTIRLLNIPADTPGNHVHAAVAAAHTYGRFPIAGEMDTVRFELPDGEQFQDWKGHGRRAGTNGKGE